MSEHPMLLAERMKGAMQGLQGQFPGHSIILVIAAGDRPEAQPVFVANTSRRWARNVLGAVLATIENSFHTGAGRLN